MWLSNGTTIGAALDQLEALMTRAHTWLAVHDEASNDDATVKRELDAWYGASYRTLIHLFTSQRHALAFRVAEIGLPFSPPRANLRAIHARLAASLVTTYDAVVAERVKIALALETLQDRIARHGEVVDLLRETHVYSEAVWERVVAEPLNASPVTALLNYGVTQNAIWDLVKLVLTTVVVAGTATSG